MATSRRRRDSTGRLVLAKASRNALLLLYADDGLANQRFRRPAENNQRSDSWLHSLTTHRRSITRFCIVGIRGGEVAQMYRWYLRIVIAEPMPLTRIKPDDVCKEETTAEKQRDVRSE